MPDALPSTGPGSDGSRPESPGSLSEFHASLARLQQHVQESLDHESSPHQKVLSYCLESFLSPRVEDRMSMAWFTPHWIPSAPPSIQRQMHDYMSELTRDAEVRVRQEIARSWDFARYFPDLADRILFDRDPTVRAECARNRSLLRERPELVKDYLTDESPIVRAAMLQHWSPLDGYVAEVKNLLADSSPEIQSVFAEPRWQYVPWVRTSRILGKASVGV